MQGMHDLNMTLEGHPFGVVESAQAVLNMYALLHVIDFVTRPAWCS